MTESEGVVDVVDDVESHRFVLAQDGAHGELVYRSEGDRLVLLHTEVPDALSGRGIAGRLVRAVIDRAAASGETVVPWCPYARSWLRKHPDAAERIHIDWSDPPARPPA